MNTNLFKIKDNILRCKTGEAKNDFSIILDSIICPEKALYSFDNNDKIPIKDKNDNVLFTQSAVAFKSIEVIKQKADGKLKIEIVNTVDGVRSRIKNLKSYKQRDSYKITLNLEFDQGERLYGLGQDEDGVINKRGKITYLYQHNMTSPMPFLISEKGYGILFDAACLIVVDDTGEQTKITFDTLDTLDYYIITGTQDEIIAGYRYLTGKAVMLPKWAFGYMQSKERYKTGDELLDVASEYRKRNVPLDCVILDWKTWEGDLWGEKIVDKQRFPNLKQTNENLHNMNVHSMVSVWPNMHSEGKNHNEFAKAGMLLNDYSTYDAFSKEARELYFEQAKRELFDGGFDAWWCDSTEPFPDPDWCGYPKRSEVERFTLVGNAHKKYLDPLKANAFALVHAKGMYENQRAYAKDKRVVNLTRSGYAGSQQYATIIWAGDTAATWGELKKEIAKGLSVGLSGLPYWTVDIGAFFTGGTACWRKWKGDENADPVWFWDGDYDDGVADENYRELYVRWLQFGVFLPIFRSHGTDTPREIWQFGDESSKYYSVIKEMIELRYKLLPYIYSLAGKVTKDDYTIMRSLLFDFAHDKRALDIEDEYMFGDSVLVCPVTKSLKDSKEKMCYLPKGAIWYDFWSGDIYEGGTEVALESELNKIPLFIKGGSIIPMQEVVQYADQPIDEIEVHVYTGSDARFDMYLDDGKTYEYENGESNKIVFDWCELSRTLCISRKNDLFLGDYTFKVIVEGQAKLTKIENGKEELKF